MLPRLKLPRSKIIVLGCGSGHDAAFLAQAGHHVTAIDFSEEAIQNAKKLYGHQSRLEFIQADVFQLPPAWHGTFDVVIEHTCFCAVDPQQRTQLVKVWRQLLHHEGLLFAVFFSMLKRSGPPFGSSEWEIRELLQSSFQFLFWGRWKNSLPERQGKELFVYGHKKDGSVWR